MQEGGFSRAEESNVYRGRIPIEEFKNLASKSVRIWRTRVSESGVQECKNVAFKSLRI